MNDVIDLAFDLNKGDLVPAVPEVDSTNKTAKSPDVAAMPFFSDKDATLDPRESIDMKLTTRTQTCFCLYSFEAVIITQDSTETMEIGDLGGRPFSITSRANSYVDKYTAQNGCPQLGIYHVANVYDAGLLKARLRIVRGGVALLAPARLADLRLACAGTADCRGSNPPAPVEH
ncbi:hypothetical protein ACIP5Y_47005 [Nocardia sp. NPDC088792]|uniref:hypothetical protein n=1 Tax=Nocardia sp. NPDC088792 TaxID=3364332 RepID=UPI00380D520A